MSWITALILILSGVFVGFINTLAGGGVAISIAVLMMLGLPANIANGTNRIAVIFQNITSVQAFGKQKLIPWKKATWLAVPTIVGSVIGAWIAVDINEAFFRKAMAIIMLIMLFFVIVKPSVWLKERPHLTEKPVSWIEMLVFFLIGIYGGFIQIGVGYYLLAGIVLGSGFDLVKANAIKVWIVLLYTMAAILVFIFNKQVHWQYGLVHAIGNIIGAAFASRMAIKRGVEFVRWVIIVVILVFSADLLGIISIKQMIHGF
ncbi:MAG: sulfite exporter TauE/SafE family protein [Bacteroidales bacterium]|nr:sulfite exporter TauE/SafE family protein [Bacteroidales bacterium]